MLKIMMILLRLGKTYYIIVQMTYLIWKITLRSKLLNQAIAVSLLLIGKKTIDSEEREKNK